ncbi:MAG: GntR family transcriptional regulator [Planctomycetota bacterium]|jgi:DNA-binding transcriptional regulator YhcF (GntR family)
MTKAEKTVGKRGRKRTVGKEVEKTLISDLENGKYKAGEQLPSLNELAANYNVSRACIHQTVHRLEKAGYLAIYQGEGTFVKGEDEKDTPADSQFRKQIRLGGKLINLITKNDTAELRQKTGNLKVSCLTDIHDFENDDICISSMQTIQGSLDQYHTMNELGYDKKSLVKLGIPENAVEQCTIGGKIMGVPVSFSPMILLANKELIRKSSVSALPEKGWTLRDFYGFAEKTTESNSEEGKRIFGFDFGNKTRDVHSLIRSMGGGWETPAAFTAENNKEALKILWKLIHDVRSNFPRFAVNFTGTGMIREFYKRVIMTERVALFMVDYSAISPCLKDRKFVRANNLSMINWGGESCDYNVLTAKKGFGAENVFNELLQMVLSTPLQAKVLRGLRELPIIFNDSIKQRLLRTFPKTMVKALCSVREESYNPWRNKKADTFFRAENLVHEYLYDIRTLKEITEDIVNERPWNIEKEAVLYDRFE